MPLFATILFALLAGFLGTVLMTLSQLLEIKFFTKREASFTPAIAVSRVFRIPFDTLSEKAKVRLNWAAHFLYGTLLGFTVPILLALGVQNLASLYIWNFIVVWGQGLIVVPLLTDHPAFWKWGGKWIFIDAFHHAVLSSATAFFWLFFFALSIGG